MTNEDFGDEESTNVSVVKEFERFGTDTLNESGYVKLVNKKLFLKLMKVNYMMK
jgi:hypothetical protein